MEPVEGILGPNTTFGERATMNTTSWSELGGAVVLGLAGCASSQPVEGPLARAPVAPRVQVPGLSFQAPAGWVSQEPASQARVAEYRLPGDPDPSADAQFVIYYFGPNGAGTIESNLTRWCRQVEQPDGRSSESVAEITELDVNGLHLNAIDLSGTYVAETFPGSGERVNKPGHRLKAAVVKTEAGPYYFKLLGPSATVSGWLTAYDDLLNSLRPAPAAGADVLGATHP